MLGAPTRDRVAERRQATRAEILAAAWDVAHEKGIAALTLKDVADRVGMRAPSLYSHFASKNAIYDAMFGQAWQGCLDAMQAVADAGLPKDPRKALTVMGRAYFDYAVADQSRNQLMNVRISADFQPSEEAYLPSLAVWELAQENFARIGLSAEDDLDLFSAVVGGLVDAQLANDPGGDRYARQLDRALGMLADHFGL
ncbi:DNA-binding transcriptional regulator, AcrR family [Pedococcus dokdonensis]|uniref:DNA-binding transcriptional regulator, AcrR family n=1 Tax=Pedococcus dokdonensis TaxID=443156 RepID=A0A1H0S1A2_9MICO|nr:TetR/AcrR family transcriptional regulator [Pedococcus dokdonensis]SDP35562.1 DNA-binding transcriptional regulator, AcrR family [Pedococcus dokdonensis]